MVFYFSWNHDFLPGLRRGVVLGQIQTYKSQSTYSGKNLLFIDSPAIVIRKLSFLQETVRVNDVLSNSPKTCQVFQYLEERAAKL